MSEEAALWLERKSWSSTGNLVTTETMKHFFSQISHGEAQPKAAARTRRSRSSDQMIPGSLRATHALPSPAREADFACTTPRERQRNGGVCPDLSRASSGVTVTHDVTYHLSATSAPTASAVSNSLDHVVLDLSCRAVSDSMASHERSQLPTLRGANSTSLTNPIFAKASPAWEESNELSQARARRC